MFPRHLTPIAVVGGVGKIRPPKDLTNKTTFSPDFSCTKSDPFMLALIIHFPFAPRFPAPPPFANEDLPVSFVLSPLSTFRESSFSGIPPFPSRDAWRKLLFCIIIIIRANPPPPPLSHIRKVREEKLGRSQDFEKEGEIKRRAASLYMKRLGRQRSIRLELETQVHEVFRFTNCAEITTRRWLNVVISLSFF